MTRATQEDTTTNRTGAALRPEQAAELSEISASTPPSSSGDGRLIAMVRNSYSTEGELLGHLPQPTDKKARPKSATRAMLLDKMGERLAFERSGTRLYEALLAKYDAPAPIGAGKNGPDRADIVRICQDEHEHFELMREALTTMGADPTAMTPAADVAATISSGIPKVLQDPRSTFAQCLDAILVAELADNEGWQLLVELAQAEGLDELADRFNDARERESEHLASVRDWVATGALAGGSLRAQG